MEPKTSTAKQIVQREPEQVETGGRVCGKAVGERDKTSKADEESHQPGWNRGSNPFVPEDTG